MKKLSLFSAAVLLAAASVVSCTDYQDDIDEINNRVTQAESVVDKANQQLEAMSKLLKAMEAGDYITSVSESAGSYTINFQKYGSITVKDGKNGKDAVAPVINLTEADPDGDGVKNLYWSKDGELIKVNGAPVRADGMDAKQPVLGINADGNWTVHYGNPDETVVLGTAVGPKGDTGAPGADAIAEPLLFQKVEVMTGFVRFTLNEKIEGTEEFKTFEVPLAVDGFEKILSYYELSSYMASMYPGQTVKLTAEDFEKTSGTEITVRKEDPNFICRQVKDGLIVTFKGCDYSNEDLLQKCKLVLSCDGKGMNIRPCGYHLVYNGMDPSPSGISNISYTPKGTMTVMMTLRGDAGVLSDNKYPKQVLPFQYWPDVKIEIEVRSEKPADATSDILMGEVDLERTEQAKTCFKIEQNVFVVFDTEAVKALNIGSKEYFVLKFTVGGQWIGRLVLVDMTKN